MKNNFFVVKHVFLFVWYEEKKIVLENNCQTTLIIIPSSNELNRQ